MFPHTHANLSADRVTARRHGEVYLLREDHGTVVDSTAFEGAGNGIPRGTKVCSEIEAGRVGWTHPTQVLSFTFILMINVSFFFGE